MRKEKQCQETSLLSMLSNVVWIIYRTFELITSSKYAKEAWDSLWKIFGQSRGKTNKKGDDSILKRARSQISSEEDHGDQESINRLRALTSIVIEESATPQKWETVEAKLSDRRGHSDLIAFSLDNQIRCTTSTSKGSKDQTREFSKLRVVV